MRIQPQRSHRAQKGKAMRDEIGAFPITVLVVSFVSACFWVAFFL
jgi:hypothetical protein